MSNEELTKLIVTLGTLGYQVVSVNPEQHVIDAFGNKLETPRTAIIISPAAKVSQ